MVVAYDEGDAIICQVACLVNYSQLKSQWIDYWLPLTISYSILLFYCPYIVPI